MEFSFYTSGAVSLARRWFYNLAATIAKELPDLFLHPSLSTIDPHSRIFIFKAATGCIIATGIITGLLLRIRKNGITLVDMYVFVYFVFILMWTHHGARYLVPILPFLVYYFLAGARWFIRSRKILYILFMALIGLNIAGNIQESKEERRVYRTPAERSFVEAVDWLKANAPADSIVMSRRPAWVNSYTAGIRGLKFLRNNDKASQYRHIMKYRTDYCIVDNNVIYRDDAKQYLMPVVEAYPDSFELVYETQQLPRTLVYRIRRHHQKEGVLR